MRKIALVTGCASGIGAAACRALSAAGYQLYGYDLQGKAAEGIRMVGGDVTNEAEAQAAVKQIVAAEGHLDLLVNCAGFGISGATEFTSLADAKRQLEVNLFGTAVMTQAVLPVMRAQGGGRIINVSSVAASAPIPFQTWYSVSKAGINAYTMALANELRPFGISVCAVMPGDTKTGFTDARKKEALGDDIYEGRISRSVVRMEKDERGGVSADVVGRLICRLAKKKSVAPLYTVGFSYQLCVLLIRLLPGRLSNFIIGKLYAS